MPTNGGGLAIAFWHQAENFLLEAFAGSNASVKTLAGNDREFDFDHVEPTGIDRCIVHVKLFAQGEGFCRWQERIDILFSSLLPLSSFTDLGRV